MSIGLPLRFEGVDLMRGFDLAGPALDGPTIITAANAFLGRAEDVVAAPQSHYSASNGCQIQRLSEMRYLQLEINFSEAAGELLVYFAGKLVDRADLTRGRQNCAVELKDVPTPALLDLSFTAAGNTVVDAVRIYNIFLSDNWGVGHRKRLKCYVPFTSAAVFSDFNVAPCCARQWTKDGHISGNTKETPFKEIWNGPRYQEMRDRFLEGKYGDICREDICPLLATGIDPGAQSQAVIHAVNEGLRVVSHGPERLMHDIDRGCNLDCVMCRDAKILPNAKNIKQALADVDSIVEMGSLEQFWFSGAGEALSMRKVLQTLETDKFSSRNIGLAFNTNLTYLNEKLWERIGHNRVLNVTVSADGCSSEVYDSIRLGGKWTEISENMRFLASLRKAGKIGAIIWNYTVQRQNVCDVGKAIRFTKEVGFDAIRFIAQLGALSRTNGNMFEDYDREALDALYSEFEKARAFNDPCVSVVETSMQNRQYLTVEHRLNLGEHLFKRRSYTGAKSSISVAEWKKCLNLVKGILADIDAGIIPQPKDISQAHAEFLRDFMATEIPVADQRPWYDIRRSPEQVEMRKLGAWARKFGVPTPKRSFIGELQHKRRMALSG